MTGDRQAFGERLRRHRERRGIALDAISESTKIAASLFAGLERGDCSRWPAGLYSRAYVRSYAEAIGLNADDIVEEFAELYSGKVQVDGQDRPAVVPRRGSGTLRLSLVDEPAVTPVKILRRSALAGADLLVAAAIAGALHLVLDPGMWFTLAGALAYQGASRVVSDEPLVSWLYRRLKTTAPRGEDKAHVDDEVQQHVGDAARTTA